MPITVRPNTTLGPYKIGDSIPDWLLTVSGLVDATLYDGADLQIDVDGVDFDLGSGSFVVTAPTATTALATYTADVTKTFLLKGQYIGQLALLIGARRYSVQDILFQVKQGPSDT